MAFPGKPAPYLSGHPPGCEPGGTWYETKECGPISCMLCCFLGCCTVLCGPYDQVLYYVPPNSSQAYKQNGQPHFIPGTGQQTGGGRQQSNQMTSTKTSNAKDMVEETHDVVNVAGLIIRAGVDKISEQVGHLQTGTMVVIAERQGNRLRLVSPVKGWASEVSSSGHQCTKFISKGETWRVTLETGAIIRADEELNSSLVDTLAMGNEVHVVAKRGRRWQIDAPLAGWFSYQTGSGHISVERVENLNPQPGGMIAPE